MRQPGCRLTKLKHSFSTPRLVRDLVVGLTSAAVILVLAFLLPRHGTPLRTAPAVLLYSVIAFLSAFFASYWQLSGAKYFQKA